MSKIKCNCPCHQNPSIKHVRPCCQGGYIEMLFGGPAEGGAMVYPNEVIPRSSVEQVRAIYPIGGYAPGNYYCRCSNCQVEFRGDKMSVQCFSCAVIATHNAYDALTNQVKDLEDSLSTLRAYLARDTKEDISLIDELLKKTGALEKITVACQRMRDNPNVAHILKLAEEALK